MLDVLKEPRSESHHFDLFELRQRMVGRRHSLFDLFVPSDLGRC